jgi:hypothetical protein
MDARHFSDITKIEKIKKNTPPSMEEYGAYSMGIYKQGFFLKKFKFSNMSPGQDPQH